jgi:hypothetical protein
MTPDFLSPASRRWPLTLLVIGLHGLLIIGLRAGLASRHVPEPHELQRVTVLLLPQRPDRVRPTPPPTERPPHEASARRPMQAPQLLNRDTNPPPAPPITAAEMPASLALPSPTASAPPTERLIDSAATRAALRQYARDPTSQERHLAAQGQEMGVSASEKLGRQVQQAGYGDCAKGQYAGGGMGLLSAPFYLLAEASGKCAKGNPPPAPPPPPEPSGRKGAHASMRDR